MSRSYVLFTNNPVMKKKITNETLEFTFIGGTSLDVLKGARDSVHMGAKLVTHPLYGNLRPHQQPYRTILAVRENGSRACDLESLSLIENALGVYQSCADRLIKPEDLPELLRDDYAYVDYELMRESFSRYRITK
ncbi:MAG: GrdX family protein [Synergistaceae bacterium]|nr:GrdX family protein [Synergistaceae bacterium]